MTEHDGITGTVTDIDGAPNLVLTRTFAAPAAEVWRELTESERLERWIGRWEGDPKSGRVVFFMTAEGEEPIPEEYTILECDPPRRFAGDTSAGTGSWLWLSVTQLCNAHSTPLDIFMPPPYPSRTTDIRVVI